MWHQNNSLHIKLCTYSRTSVASTKFLAYKIVYIHSYFCVIKRVLAYKIVYIFKKITYSISHNFQDSLEVNGWKNLL